MGEIALEVKHVSIDYKNLMHMSLHQSFLNKEVKKADIIRAVDDVSLLGLKPIPIAIKETRFPFLSITPSSG